MNNLKKRRTSVLIGLALMGLSVTTSDILTYYNSKTDKPGKVEKLCAFTV